MVITDLSTQKKNIARINISLDGEFRGVLYDEIVYANGIKVGEKISEKYFEKLLADSQNYFAKNDAFKYVSKCLKTEKEIKDFMYKKGYHKPSVEYAISLIKEYKLIDDRKYCSEYYRSHQETKSNSAIKNALKLKGISDELINEIVVDDGEKELQLAKKLTEKLADVDDKNITYKKLMKLKRQLYSRGISFENIDKATADFVVINEIYGENE